VIDATCAAVVLAAIVARPAGPQAPQGAEAGVRGEAAAVYPQVEPLYQDLHQHPELSLHEQRTATTLADGLRDLGFDVTTGVGGTGIVGVLRNGPGPTVLVRTELDALPVTEDTGLPYASTVRTTTDAGVDVGVMHACGHDVHMAAWMGTARVMSTARGRWSGTLVLAGQPAEEVVRGAKAMIADGLLTRFPRPDYALAVHDDPRLPAGVVGYHAGPILTNMDGLDITVFGRGGHGAHPEATVDPIVLASRLVLGLQTIVSREISPFEAAVITVGSIHGGTKNNIIPDEVRLQLTVRSFTPEVREHLLSAIARQAKAEAAAAGAPREPRIDHVEGTTALVNDPDLTARVARALARELGRDVADAPPEMASEDFSEFAAAGIPTLMLRVGATAPARLERAAASGDPVPSLHSAHFAPVPGPTITSAIAAELVALRTLMPPAVSR
jgi:amidohydrolase